MKELILKLVVETPDGVDLSRYEITESAFRLQNRADMSEKLYNYALDLLNESCGHEISKTTELRDTLVKIGGIIVS